MKHLLTIVAALLCCVYANTLFAAEPARLAVFDGGHPFAHAAFDAMLTDVAGGAKIERFHFPADRDKLGPELADRFDAILFYDMDNTSLSDAQKQRIDALFQKGIGILALHHHVCSNQKWPEYWKYIGGIAVFKTNRNIEGETRPLSTFICGETIAVKVVPNELFDGIEDFSILDEAYGNCYVDPKATVLLTTENPKSTRAVAWRWQYGKSPVVALLLGHDAKAYRNPGFQAVMKKTLTTLYRETRELRDAEQRTAR